MNVKVMRAIQRPLSPVRKATQDGESCHPGNKSSSPLGGVPFSYLITTRINAKEC